MVSDGVDPLDDLGLWQPDQALREGAVAGGPDGPDGRVDVGVGEAAVARAEGGRDDRSRPPKTQRTPAAKPLLSQGSRPRSAETETASTNPPIDTFVHTFEVERVRHRVRAAGAEVRGDLLAALDGVYTSQRPQSGIDDRSADLERWAARPLRFFGSGSPSKPDARDDDHARPRSQPRKPHAGDVHDPAPVMARPKGLAGAGSPSREDLGAGRRRAFGRGRRPRWAASPHRRRDLDAPVSGRGSRSRSRRFPSAGRRRGRSARSRGPRHGSGRGGRGRRRRSRPSSRGCRRRGRGA